MATPSQTIKRLDALTGDALRAAAIQATTEANKWVPVDSNELRRSKEVGPVVRSGNRVSITISYNTAYARKQYLQSLRHFMPGGLPAPVTSYARPPGKAGRKNLYGRAYRKALRDGVMRRVANGLQWLDRAIKNGRSRININRVFVNFFK